MIMGKKAIILTFTAGSDRITCVTEKTIKNKIINYLNLFITHCASDLFKTNLNIF